MEKGKIAPEEQFLPLSTIFYYLMLDFYVKTGIRFFLRDKRLFEITKVEITRVDCILFLLSTSLYFEDEWMNGLQLFVLFNSNAVVSGRWDGANGLMYALESRLRLERFLHLAGLEPRILGQQASSYYFKEDHIGQN